MRALFVGLQRRRRLSKMWSWWVLVGSTWISSTWNEVIKWTWHFLFIVSLLYYCRYAVPIPIWWHRQELGGETTYVEAMSTSAAWANTRHQHMEGHDGMAKSGCKKLMCTMMHGSWRFLASLLHIWQQQNIILLLRYFIYVLWIMCFSLAIMIWTL